MLGRGNLRTHRFCIFHQKMGHLTPSCCPPKTPATHSSGLWFLFPAQVTDFCKSILPGPGCNIPTSIMSTHFCSGRFYLFLQGQPGLGGGLSNSIGLQICLESILILFKGQSIGASLGGSEQEFHIALNMR